MRTIYGEIADGSRGEIMSMGRGNVSLIAAEHPIEALGGICLLSSERPIAAQESLRLVSRGNSHDLIASSPACFRLLTERFSAGRKDHISHPQRSRSLVNPSR